jgi:hypothetical protein
MNLEWPKHPDLHLPDLAMGSFMPPTAGPPDTPAAGPTVQRIHPSGVTLGRLLASTMGT